MTNLNTNLLLNPGAEAGTGTSDGTVVEPIPDWTTSSNFTVVEYAAGNGFPDAAKSTAIGGGNNFFAGGPTCASSSAYQIVSFGDLASSIDVGGVAATLSGDLGGFTNQDDQIDLSATWLDSLGHSLGSFTLPIVNAAARGDTTGFEYESGTVVIPVGSRSARIEMDATRYAGTFNDGYADNVSFVMLACYRRGTMIATPDGEVPIEELRLGEPVLAHDGTSRPIKWIGRRAYDGRFIAGNRGVLPIRIAANAIADGVPHQDLDVSPKHAMLIDGVLVPAELLVNGVSIWQLDAVDEVTYFHIELETHDTIVAEGAPSETFVDCGNRGMFQNAEEFARLYPADDRPSWQFCAERLDERSPKLRSTRARLEKRAGLRHSRASGNPSTMDPRFRRVDESSRSRVLAVQQVLRRYRASAPATHGSMQPVAARRYTTSPSKAAISL